MACTPCVVTVHESVYMWLPTFSPNHLSHLRRRPAYHQPTYNTSQVASQPARHLPACIHVCLQAYLPAFRHAGICAHVNACVSACLLPCSCREHPPPKVFSGRQPELFRDNTPTRPPARSPATPCNSRVHHTHTHGAEQQHSAAQSSTPPHSTAQHGTAWHTTAQSSSEQHRTTPPHLFMLLISSADSL